MRSIIVIAHNIRSTHNIGSLLRTCDGIGVSKLYLTGYTPYPASKIDNRLPHIIKKLDNQIHKTALGAEKSVNWRYDEDPLEVISNLKKKSYTVFALEQTKYSLPLHKVKSPKKIALVIGNEVKGLDMAIIKASDKQIEIPMLGKKESYNVIQATAMALFYLRFNNQ